MMGVVDESETGGPDERPGQDEPGNRRKVSAPQEGDDRHRHPKHDDQVLEVLNFRHDSQLRRIPAVL